MSEPRIVLITGGSRGIGLACAERFKALGDHVAVTYNSSPPPEGFFGVKCDVTDTEQVDAAFVSVEAEFGGPVEVLVSNAGVARDGLLQRQQLEGRLLDLLAGPVDLGVPGDHLLGHRGVSGQQGLGGAACRDLDLPADPGQVLEDGVELLVEDVAHGRDPRQRG